MCCNNFYTLIQTKAQALPRKYLKMSAQIIAPILAELSNTCIQTGIYPTILKVGQILPIFKRCVQQLQTRIFFKPSYKNF